MTRLPYRFIRLLMFLIATCYSRVEGFWFFSCPHGNGQGQAGDVCSAFCSCHQPNTCEAGIQRCTRPGLQGERCHATRPCAPGFSCHPGVQKCFHVPRRHGEPCVAGFECGTGLSCEPGVQLCFYHPRGYNEPCSVGFSCSPGLSCQPGSQQCLHHPRQENERCSAGYTCADGLVCRLCDKPYATCQLARVPAFTDQDYDRPFNKVAFLVTHNSFSNSPSFAFWARNQRFSISQQLQDGVRGLMLDIYPGWGEEDVRLCHASCFWGGSTNLLDSLTEIRKFLDKNPREVITIIFEDYLRNPTILKRVFDQAGVSSYVLLEENWSDGINDWPTLRDMHRLGRLVVFNNNGLSGFPYTKYNMWHYVRENRYGNEGQNKKECVDRAESRWNKAWNDDWSLVLINWFSTAANPLQPCLNSFKEIKEKLVTCHGKFGLWANFVAVNYYAAGSGGGAFQAVSWLNNMFRRETPVAKERKASFIPFPLIVTVNHSASKANHKLHREMEPFIKRINTIDESGYGSGFHNLSDIITHILRHDTSLDNKNSTIQNRTSASRGKVFMSDAATDSHTMSRQSQNDKRSKIQKSDQIIEPSKMLPGNLKKNPDELSLVFKPHKMRILNHSLRPFRENVSQRESFRSETRNSRAKGIDFEEPTNSTDRLSPRHFGGKYDVFVKDNKRRKSKMRDYHHIPEDMFTDASRKAFRLGRGHRKDKSQGNGPHRESQGKLLTVVSDRTRQRTLLPTTLRQNTIAKQDNPTTKLRNLRRQLARLKTRLNSYLHLAYPHRKRRKPE